MFECRAGTQGDLGKLQEGANKNLMKFKKRPRVLYQKRNSPIKRTTWELTGWEEASAEKDLAVPL